MFLRFALLFLVSWSLAAEARQEQVVGDFHVTHYTDLQNSAEGFEAFTKHTDKKVFFGLSCSIQSPFPLMQVIVFDNQVISETPKYLKVNLKVDGIKLESKVNGVLSVINNAEEFSNKIRFEMKAKPGSSLQDLQSDYMQLLKQLSNAKRLIVELQHRSLENAEYTFSLEGFKSIVNTHASLCR